MAWSLSQQHDGLIDPSLCISPIYMLGYWTPRLCSVESRHPSKPPLASPFILYSIGPWWWSRESPTVYAGSKCRPGSRLLQIPRTRTRDKDISLARALNCLKCYYTKTFFLSFSCFFFCLSVVSSCLSPMILYILPVYCIRILFFYLQDIRMGCVYTIDPHVFIVFLNAAYIFYAMYNISINTQHK